VALFDMPLQSLTGYLPERTEPPDFDGFWRQTLDQARSLRRPGELTLSTSSLAAVDAIDVTFSGHGGDAIKAWLMLPKDRTGPIPCIVEYLGYGRGRGFPVEWLLWSALGYAHFVMDNRGQAAQWGYGETPDSDTGPNPEYPGFLTRGILDAHRYYYRRLITDAVLAVDLVRDHPAIDPNLVVVAGGSQGGGLALAVAGLAQHVAGALIDVPFMCHVKRAIEVTDSHPYAELREFLRMHREKVDRVFAVLDYFDGVNFAVRAEAPSLFSVGLMDDICPPSTVFAAYNHYAGPKEIRVWPYNGHEGGGVQQVNERIDFVDHLVAAPR
jgi:cephalosporin-C deacetylase